LTTYGDDRLSEALRQPIAFYSDKHATFRVNKVGATGGDGMTQFGRALHELNIDIICANVPQAKGRVERANGTLQDRLVKEMRLAGISTIEAGNAFLPAFMADYNRRFAKEPFNDKDLHRPLAAHDNIDDAFAWKELRRRRMPTCGAGSSPGAAVLPDRLDYLPLARHHFQRPRDVFPELAQTVAAAASQAVGGSITTRSRGRCSGKV